MPLHLRANSQNGRWNSIKSEQILISEYNGMAVSYVGNG